MLDVGKWLEDLGQKYTHETKAGGVEAWHLHPCPFCGKNDSSKDSTILRQPDGRIGWNCFHQSCEGANVVRDAAAAGKRVSGWSVLCGKLGRPRADHVSGSSSAPTSERWAPWREREALSDPPLDFDTTSWHDLKREDLRLDWLVPGALVAGQPLIVGGGSKTLKTSITIDLLVSLAGRGRWLGVYDAPAEPVPSLFISGESGRFVLRNTIERVIEERRIHDDNMPLYVATSLPKLSVKSHITKTRDEIKRVGAKVFVLDPAYLAMLQGDGGEINLFKIGSILRDFNEVAIETGATLVLLHHFRKIKEKDFTPPTLEEFSYAGFAEWARQWVLLKRREEFRPGSGLHELYVSIQGSAGQSAAWALTVNEGTPDDPLIGRMWSTYCEPYVAEKHTKRAIEGRGQTTAILNELRAAPEPLSTSQLSDLIGKSTRIVNIVIKELITQGAVKKEFRRSTPVYRYVPLGDDFSFLD